MNRSHDRVPFEPSPTENFAAMLASSKVVVCVGPGGVGKTSTAAALALGAARAGRRTVVLTIDPARRLANALGLPEFGNEERDVAAEAFSAVALAPPEGRLSAMMLDIKTAWDQVVTKYHPDEKARQKLMSNRLYQTLSSALAGSQEYMAMEKLHELATRASDPYDLIVLDTPPAEHAMDFLEAPSRMLDALDNDATRWLLEPHRLAGRFGQKLFDAGSTFVLRVISRFTGTELLQELAELLASFQGMFEGFRQRAEAVKDILARRDTTFVVVGTPRPTSLAAVSAFHERLVSRGIRIGAVVLNRGEVDAFQGAQPMPRAELARVVEEQGGSGALAERLAEEAERAQRVHRREVDDSEALRRRLSNTLVVQVPELPTDVHDLLGLELLRAHLLA